MRCYSPGGCDVSEWMHAICVPCWNRFRMEPKGYQDTMTTCAPEVCCWCGAVTVAGIFLRGDPATMECGGIHMDDVMLRLQAPCLPTARSLPTARTVPSRRARSSPTELYHRGGKHDHPMAPGSLGSEGRYAHCAQSAGSCRGVPETARGENPERETAGSTSGGRVTNWVEGLSPEDRSSWDAYVEHVRTETLTAMSDSALVMTILGSQFDVKQATELGMAILLGKPLLVIQQPGAVCPPALRKLAYDVVEADIDLPDSAARVARIIKRMQSELADD